MEKLVGTNSSSKNHFWVLEFWVFTDTQLAKEDSLYLEVDYRKF